ncbi:terminase small subunit [uncultured Roseobacter sp.]|uniref:terminase small subunit n=1 Tax=uncultured Roseobacter sp. TaxID=114847 RepID=UPI00260F9056|nr:terminase small subunit [uncultured Roseobacter sp.]
MSSGEVPLKNHRKELFCQHYVGCFNASEAARKAGYSQKTAGSQGARLLKDVAVQERVAFLQSENAKALELDTADVLERWTTLALADPNELISHIVGSCRHCHGKGFKYQWRDQDEFEDHHQAWSDLPEKARDSMREPSNAGGYGYRFRREPNIECPQCDGFGRQRTVAHDTTRLSPAAKTLYAGVKETQHGIEIKMEDRAAALNNIARTLGMFAKDNERTLSPGDKLQEWYETFSQNGSRAPIQPQKETPPK